jgi:hypothetical protein
MTARKTDRGRMEAFFWADSATRGRAISFRTPASTAFADSFRGFFCLMPPSWHLIRRITVQFGTKATGGRLSYISLGTMKGKASKKGSLDVRHYLGAAGRLVKFPKKRTIFTQGDSGDSVFYLRDGIVIFSGRGASAAALQCAWPRPRRWLRQPL